MVPSSNPSKNVDGEHRVGPWPIQCSENLQKSVDYIVKNEINKKRGEYMSDILKAEVDPKTNFPYVLPIQMHLD